MCILLVHNLRWKNRRHDTFRLVVGHQLVLQVNEAGISFIDFPSVSRWRAVTTSTSMLSSRRTHNARFMRASIAFVVRHSYLELDVLSEVWVLPHEELDVNWIMAIAQLLMKLILGIFSRTQHVAEFNIVQRRADGMRLRIRSWSNFIELLLVKWMWILSLLAVFILLDDLVVRSVSIFC